MKKLFLLAFVWWASALYAQVPEWYNAATRSQKYPNSIYITGFKVDKLHNGETVGAAAERLVRAARVNAVATIQVRVENETIDKLQSMQQQSSAGKQMAQNRELVSKTRTSVDMELSNLKSETYFDADNNKIAAFVYVKISDLIRQTDRKLSATIVKIESGLEEMDELVNNGDKLNAKTKGEKLEPFFADIDDLQRILIAVDADTDEEGLQMETTQQLRMRYVKTMAALKNGINIFLSCKADLFGSVYPTLANTIKGDLSKLGATFVTSPDQADWAIVINANARQYNAPTIGGYTTYFAYIDASIAIDKMATGQRIYEDAFSEKGGHTHNYTEAARDGYKQITPKLAAVINQYIKQ